MIRLKIHINRLEYICLLLYFVAISAFQLGTGLDAIIIRFSFVMLLCVTIFLRRGMKIYLTQHLKWCFFFWGVYFLSMIWAKNAADTLAYVNNSIQIIGMSMCIVLIVKDHEDIDKLIKLIIFSMFFTAIRLIIYTPQSSWGTDRVGAVIGMNANGLGMRMAIAAIMSLYMIHKTLEQKKHKKKKWMVLIYITLLILFFCIVLFTGSKKSLFVLAAGLVSYEILITKGWKFLLKIITMVILLGMLFWIIFNNQMLYRILGRRIERMILTLQGTAFGLDIDRSLSERRFYIQQAKRLFLEHPFLGYGGNNFLTYMREINYSHVAYSHNNYFELLSTLGILGFVIYYFMWIKTSIKLKIKYDLFKSNRYLLMEIILIIELIMDYGNVSYQSVFTQLMLLIGYLTCVLGTEKKITNKQSVKY